MTSNMINNINQIKTVYAHIILGWHRDNMTETTRNNFWTTELGPSRLTSESCGRNWSLDVDTNLGPQTCWGLPPWLHHYKKLEHWLLYELLGSGDDARNHSLNPMKMVQLLAGYKEIIDKRLFRLRNNMLTCNYDNPPMSIDIPNQTWL